MNKPTKNIKEALLTQINKGEISMRPRWHFMLKTILAITGISLLAISLLFLLSFIAFFLHQSGIFLAPMFGLRGVLFTLVSSPWILILLALVFIVTLEVLVRKYAFGYRKPLLYTMLGIVLFSSLGTYMISQTHVHQRMSEMAASGDLTFINSMHEKYGRSMFEHMHFGHIESLTDNGFVLRDRNDVQKEIVITDSTFLPKGSVFEPNQRVVVLGELLDDNSVEALGVRPVPEDMPFPSGFRGFNR